MADPALPITRARYQIIGFYAVCAIILTGIFSLSGHFAMSLFPTHRVLLDLPNRALLWPMYFLLCGFAIWRQPSFKTATPYDILKWALRYSVLFALIGLCMSATNYINGAWDKAKPQHVQSKIVNAGYVVGGRGSSSGYWVTVEDWRKPQGTVRFNVQSNQIYQALKDNACMKLLYGKGALGLGWVADKSFASCDMTLPILDRMNFDFMKSIHGLPNAIPVSPKFADSVGVPKNLVRWSSPIEAVTFHADCRLRLNIQGRVIEGHCQSPPYDGWARAVLEKAGTVPFRLASGTAIVKPMWVRFGPVTMDILPSRSSAKGKI
jgi:hypothetical protein